MERLKKERNPLILFLGLTGLIVMSAYVNIFPPDSLTHILIFLVILAVSLGLLCSYVFRKTRHTVLITLGVMLYLVLRYFGLRHPLYAVLLFASIIALEYLWKDSIH